jgi:hypothetical protein
MPSGCKPLAGALGITTGVALNFALTGYAGRTYRRWKELYPPVNLTPESVR